MAVAVENGVRRQHADRPERQGCARQDETAAGYIPTHQPGTELPSNDSIF